MRVRSLLLLLPAVFYGTLCAEAVDLTSNRAKTADRHATSIGVRRDGTPIAAAIDLAAGYDSETPRVLIVDRRRAADGAPLPCPVADRFSTSIVWAAPPSTTPFPPAAGYYDDPTDPESRYLWRWIGMHAPDLVVEVVRGEQQSWFVPAAESPLLTALAKSLPSVQAENNADSLISQLSTNAPCGVGSIPAVRVATNSDDYLATLGKSLGDFSIGASTAKTTLRLRSSRTPSEIAQKLLETYGRELPQVQYIPALSIVGRLRANSSLNGGDKAPIPPIVLKATGPYVTGSKSALDAKANGSTFSGHLIFAELADRTGDAKYVALVKAAADRAFHPDGSPREAMPAHNEMSDAAFMGSPILAAAGKLTGDAKYYEACLRNIRFVQKLCLRDDGLYRHSPLDEAAWGRGNGFPALGLTWSLDYLPASFAGRAEVAAALERHLTALLPHQDYQGSWHQVIDKPESYAEFTCTAMITYAMARGVRLGRLDEAKYADAIRRGWDAVRRRIADDGTLVDVCTGTGKQQSLRDYYDRPAILGRDDRGGAMALMLATEMMLHEAERK